MAEWAMSDRSRRQLDVLSREITGNKLQQVKELRKKKVITLEDVELLQQLLPEEAPIFLFLNELQNAARVEKPYKASEAFVEMTRKLKMQAEDRDYRRLVRDVDASQRYGQVHHMENFGEELRTVNRQLMSVFNVVLTVVCGFFFGFSGVTFLYPQMEIDLAVRFLIGLIIATIIFFADLYFVVKGM